MLCPQWQPALRLEPRWVISWQLATCYHGSYLGINRKVGVGTLIIIRPAGEVCTKPWVKYFFIDFNKSVLKFIGNYVSETF